MCEVRKISDTLTLDTTVSKVHNDYVNHKIEKFGCSPRLYGCLYEANTDEFGNEVLTKVSDNCVVAGGAILTLMKLAGVKPNWLPASFNQIWNINSDIEGNPENSKVALFGVGTGGCGIIWNDVKDPDPKQRDIDDIVPIRVATEDMLSGTDADKYYMKTKMPGDTGLNAWMLKEFDQPIQIRSLWKDAAEDGEDGTEINGEIYDSTRTEGQEHFMEMVLKFNKNDVRSYYEAIGSLKDARFNTIGIYTGEKVVIDAAKGIIDYVNVRLFSVINIANDSVQERKEIKYVYRIYAMI